MILFRYILRNHIAPFLFSIITLMFIFLFQFLMKFADRLVGKGLGLWVILKLVTYNLAWMVVLVVPMAVLIATLMAFGNMSGNNEISIMKASGVSVYKMVLAPLLASVVICLLLIQFNNRVYPDANHQAKILMQDVSNKKPTLSLVPDVFSQEIPNFAILSRKIDENSNILYGVTIYDYSTPGKLNVVTAKKGKIYFSNDQRKLLMDLNEGEIHETNIANSDIYRKLIFSRHRIAMNAEEFSFQQSSPGSVQRGNRELSAGQMHLIVDSLNKIDSGFRKKLYSELRLHFPFNEAGFIEPSIPGERSSDYIYYKVKNRIAAAKNSVNFKMDFIESNKKEINNYLVEIYKKYSLPVACIVFVLIGAPLGIMTKRGGLGVAASVSVIFFLVYWAFLIGGEKLADRDMISPFWGMWSANFVLGILGSWLTVRSAREMVSVDFTWIKRFVPKHFKKESADIEIK